MRVSGIASSRLPFGAEGFRYQLAAIHGPNQSGPIKFSVYIFQPRRRIFGGTLYQKRHTLSDLAFGTAGLR